MKTRWLIANSVAVAFIAALVPHANVGMAATTDAKAGQAAPGNAQIEELQGQIRTMQQQLDKLSATQGAASQQSQMRQHWQSMQDYMRRMQGMPWMQMGPPTSGPPPMGPGMMGPGMMGRGMRGPRAQGDWMMGCPMTGMPGAAWQLPPGMSCRAVPLADVPEHAADARSDGEDPVHHRPGRTPAPAAGTLAGHVPQHAVDARHGLDVGRTDGKRAGRETTARACVSGRETRVDLLYPMSRRTDARASHRRRVVGRHCAHVDEHQQLQRLGVARSERAQRGGHEDHPRDICRSSRADAWPSGPSAFRAVHAAPVSHRSAAARGRAPMGPQATRSSRWRKQRFPQ